MKNLPAKLLLGFILASVLLLNYGKTVSAQTFTFGATGDFGFGAPFTATVNKIKAENVEFLVALGDFAYTPNEQGWCNVWKTAGFNNLVLISGNHDEGSSDGNINNYVTHCPTLNVQKTGTYGKEFYFDYPQSGPIARFIQISPGLGGSAFTGMNTSYRIGSPGYNFVTNAIDGARNAGYKWVIVSMHKNYISAMEKPNELGPDLINMLISKKVDLILQGHEHGYERSKQLSCAKVNLYDASCVVDSDNNLVKGAGSIIHIIGTGGQGPRGLNRNDTEYPYFAAADNTTLGFGKFTVSPTTLNYQFIISGRGSFTDSFTISGGGGPNPTPTGTGGNLQAVDVNGDRTINIIDIGIVVDNYGRSPIPNPKADINRDSAVNIIDIGLIIDRYGQSY
jgi:hypothetical protein